MRKLAFCPDVYLISMAFYPNVYLISKMCGFKQGARRRFGVPSLMHCLENASPVLGELVANRKGTTISLPLSSGVDSLKCLSEFCCTGFCDVDNITCAFDLIRLAEFVKLQGLFEAACEFLSREDVLRGADGDLLLQIFDLFVKNNKPCNQVLKTLLRFYVFLQDLDVTKLGVCALARLLAELPQDTLSDQEPVTTTIIVYLEGMANSIFYSDAIQIGKDAKNRSVHVNIRIHKNNSNIGYFIKSGETFIIPLVSFTCNLIEPKGVGCVQTRVPPMKPANPDAVCARLFSNDDDAFFSGNRLRGRKSIFESAPRLLGSHANAFFSSNRLWGRKSVFGAAPPQFIAQDPNSSGRRYLTAQFTFQLKRNVAQQLMLERWARAQGFEGKAPCTAPIDLLVFCASKFGQALNAALLPYVAFHFKRASVEPAFCSLSADILVQLLERDEVNRSDEDALLLSLGPWMARHSVDDVVRVLAHVKLLKVHVRTVKASLAVGGVLHPFKNEIALQRLLVQNFQNRWSKRPFESDDRDDAPPNEYLCPITHDLMTDPVVCADGHTYERAAIKRWLANAIRSPMSNEELANNSLVPNHCLRNVIDKYREQLAANPQRKKQQADLILELLKPIEYEDEGLRNYNSLPAQSAYTGDTVNNPICFD
jgi:hypothetical protein